MRVSFLRAWRDSHRQNKGDDDMKKWILSVFTVLCSATVVSAQPVPELPAAARRSAQGLDALFLKFADNLPGFAGYFYNDAGDLVVQLTDRGDERPRAHGPNAGMTPGRDRLKSSSSAHSSISRNCRPFARILPPTPRSWRRYPRSTQMR